MSDNLTSKQCENCDGTGGLHFEGENIACPLCTNPKSNEEFKPHYYIDFISGGDYPAIDRLYAASVIFGEMKPKELRAAMVYFSSLYKEEIS